MHAYGEQSLCWRRLRHQSAAGTVQALELYKEAYFGPWRVLSALGIAASRHLAEMAPCLAGRFGTIALLKQCSGLALDKGIVVAPQQNLALCC